MAVNMPIQGGAADIMKQAMILVDQALREQGLRSRILLQVHDELLPVSYTHLDVYKRQPVGMCTLMLSTVISTRSAMPRS